LVNVCAIGEPGEDVSSLRPGAESEKIEEAEAPTNQVEPDEEEKASAFLLAQENNKELKISPRARALAQKLDLDASQAKGSGPYSRIIERDILSLQEQGGQVAQRSTDSSTLDLAALDSGEYTDVKASKIRTAIAQAMSNSLATTAQLTNHHSFDATDILDFRKSLKNKSESLELPNITLNDIILFAVSRTLLKHPLLNAHLLEDGTLRQFKSVHLGVAIDTPRGLMVPTLFNADKKSLSEIALEVKELAQMAQSGTINPDLLQRATFTVTNLGALGVEMFTPILNPPQTGILGVCNIITRLKQVGDKYEPYPAMGLSVTYDHRAVDGVPEARFANELVDNLENFTSLLL